jgi:glucokinase
MAQLSMALISRHQEAKKVLGIGIGSPGPLSRERKMIFQTPNLPGFDQFPLGKKVEELTGLKVFFDNDAKCAAIGEKVFGAAKTFKHFVLMTFGTGIGGGVFCDGKMIYGKSDGACEVGHLTLHPDGVLCNCGNRGCFEQYCSATAIERRAALARGAPCTVNELFVEYERQAPWAKKCVHEVAKDLAIASASLVNIFDPEAVVFGGGVFTTGGGPLLSIVKEEIKSRCFASSQVNLRLIPSQLNGNAGVVGAAAQVFFHNI